MALGVRRCHTWRFILGRRRGNLGFEVTCYKNIECDLQGTGGNGKNCAVLGKVGIKWEW